MKIHFIMTGGTIDSYWNAPQDTVVVAEHSILPEYIKGLKMENDTEFTEVCMKDSRALKPEDVKKVYETVVNTDATKIIITHGTYTMPDTAKYLKSNLKRKDQTIIVTGSMTPLKGFDLSDAAFNLGFAVAKIQDIDPGVYVAMNGKLFTADEVVKSLAEGRFYSVFNNEQ